MTISRRRLLIGAGAATVGAAGGGFLLVREGVLPGRQRLASALGACDVPVPETGTAPGRTVTGAFDSLRRGRRVGTVVVYPPGRSPGERLPVCLVLHGYGSDATGAIGSGAYDRYLATQVAAGTPPFALAAMDGGNGYWHPHATDDPLGALLDEFLPRLSAQGLVTDRFGVLGWSMGGYGAPLCAVTVPTRVAAGAARPPPGLGPHAQAPGRDRGAVAP